jgi:hypothetical protein
MKQLIEKNPELIVFSVSLLATIVVSTIFGFAGGTLVGGFWSWFWISLLTQIIGFFVINSILLQKQQNIQRVLEIEEIGQLAKFTISLNCAYCKQVNSTPIVLNQKNTFKCVSCNQVNGVFMQFTATTLTTPIDLKPQLKDV